MKNLINELSYISYASNRGYGMTHEQLVRIGLGDALMLQKYEQESKHEIN